LEEAEKELKVVREGLNKKRHDAYKQFVLDMVAQGKR
jgi:hypothetical protein